MNNKPVFALDADGVLLDCDKAFRQVGEDLLQRPLFIQNNAYAFHDRYGISKNDVHNVFDRMIDHPQGWRGMPLMPGADQAFLMLQEHYDVHVVTAIPERLRAHREENLAAFGLYPTTIHCTGDFSSSKQAIMQQLRPIGFVDDRLWHLHEVDFIDHLVWVDLNHHQDGHVPHDRVYQTTSLLAWTQSWLAPSVRRARL